MSNLARQARHLIEVRVPALGLSDHVPLAEQLIRGRKIGDEREHLPIADQCFQVVVMRIGGVENLVTLFPDDQAFRLR